MSVRRLVLACLVIGGGCGAPLASPDDGGDVDAPADDGGDLDDAAAADMGPACPPGEEPAATEVEVFVHNPNGADRLVATEEDRSGYCDRIALVDGGGRKLALSFGQQIVCEGPPPVPPHASTWRRVRSDETLLLGVWDGRELGLCTRTVPCDPPWKGVPPQQVIAGSPHPATAGFYHLTVAEELYPPMGCQSNDGVLYRCDRWSSMNGRITAIAELCPSSMTAATDFALPAQGRAAVTVELK